MKLKIVFDEISQQAWAVRVVANGEKFGLNNALIHCEAEPLVEFYDTRYGHTDLGQFVSRYNLTTLLDHTGGLNLYGGTPSWCIHDNAMARVVAWLKTL